MVLPLAAQAAEADRPPPFQTPPADAPDFVRRAWAAEMKVRLTNAVAESQRSAEASIEERLSSGELDEAERDRLLSDLRGSTTSTRQRIRKAEYAELVRLAGELLSDHGSTEGEAQARSEETASEPGEEESRPDG